MEIGELVCLYRRKHKGLGIILAKGTINPHEIQILETAKKSDWQKKSKLKQKLLREAADQDLLEAAFTYNLWQTNAKLKKDFVYIKWLHRPSEYEQTKTSADADWFPLDWVGRVA